jgi:hypothetical protein
LESRKTGGGTRSGQVARQSDTKVDRSSEAQLTAPNRQSPRLEVMGEKRSRLLCSFRDEECKQLHKAIVLRKCLNSQEPEWFGKVSDQFGSVESWGGQSKGR